MSFIVFIACLVIVIRRSRRRESLAVPAVLGALALVSSVQAALGLLRMTEVVANTDRQHQAGILAAGIVEVTASFVRGLVFSIPVLAGAYFLDRRLRRRRPPAGPPQATPEGSLCANHPDRLASTVCLRCGAFMCDACSVMDRKLCTSCSGRLAPPA